MRESIHDPTTALIRALQQAGKEERERRRPAKTACSQGLLGPNPPARTYALGGAAAMWLDVADWPRLAGLREGSLTRAGEGNIAGKPVAGIRKFRPTHKFDHQSGCGRRTSTAAADVLEWRLHRPWRGATGLVPSSACRRARIVGRCGGPPGRGVPALIRESSAPSPPRGVPDRLCVDDGRVAACGLSPPATTPPSRGLSFTEAPDAGQCPGRKRLTPDRAGPDAETGPAISFHDATGTTPRARQC